MTPDSLTRTVQDFLSEASGAVVLEDGAVAFDLGQAKYSISGDYNKCLLHLWSAERNSVRRVLDAEVKNGILKLAVQRLGQSRPSRLEICRERDRRSPSAKKAARTSYEQKLRRALDRHFPGFAVTRLTTAIDLEKSFGPIYARGALRKGQTAFAILGVNAAETQASIDAALTFGILWLEVCRQSSAGKFLVEGLHLFVPHGCSALVRERMANLNPAAAKWSLFELDERHDALVEIDCTDRGNVATRLVHATNETAARERFAESIVRINTILPNCEVAVLSAAELAFRWRGLEFARARMGAEAVTFRSKQEIVFGVGAEERVLEDRNFTFFLQLLAAVRDIRHPYGRPSAMAAASGTLAGIAGGGRRQRHRRTPGVARTLFAGSRLLRLRPRHARRANHHAKRPPGGRRTQGRRRYSPPAARSGLLVKSRVASHARRISPLRIFPRT